MNSSNVSASWMTYDEKLTTALLIRSRSAPGDVRDNAYQPREGTSTAEPSIVTIRNGFPAPIKADRNVFPAANRTNSPLGGVRTTAPTQRAGNAAARLHAATAASAAVLAADLFTGAK